MNKRTNQEPQRIGLLIDPQDLRSAENNALRLKRDYVRKQPYKPQKPVRARFKAKFFFLDGNTCVKYSYDYVNTSQGVKIDEWKGLTKLDELILKWSDKIATVTIYANVNPQPYTSTSEYNLKIKSMSRNWLTWETNVSFNIDGIAKFEPLKERVIKSRLNV